MKFTLIALSLVAFVAFAQADTSAIPSSDELIKKMTDSLDEVVKNIEKLTGLKTDYDKNKVKGYLEKAVAVFEENYKKAKEFLESNGKNFPEELRKKVDAIFVQVQEQLKTLNSPEVQKSAAKFQETVTDTVKKVSAAGAEFLKSVGLALPPSFQKTTSDMIDELNKSSDKLKEKFTKLVEDAQNELKKKKSS